MATYTISIESDVENVPLAWDRISGARAMVTWAQARLAEAQAERDRLLPKTRAVFKDAISRAGGNLTVGQQVTNVVNNGDNTLTVTTV